MDIQRALNIPVNQIRTRLKQDLTDFAREVITRQPPVILPPPKIDETVVGQNERFVDNAGEHAKQPDIPSFIALVVAEGETRSATIFGFLG